MLGRHPRLPHRVMRWLIITLMILNGAQVVLLQGAINSSALGQVGTTWTYVALSAGVLAVSLALLAYAFLRERQAPPAAPPKERP